MPESLPNLRHLKLLVEIAQRGSTNAAARALHMTQPAATQAVASLEKLFGARLFERSPAGMSLTGAGRTGLPRIERLLAQIEEAINEARRVKSSRAEPAWHSMSATHLNALAAFVEHGSFGAAARAGDVARPTLHRAARELERRMGATLFENTSYGLVPTREAQQLARRVRLAFMEIGQAHAEIAALAGVDRGRSVVGAMPLARSFLVPQALLRLLAEHPKHTVAILDGPYESLIDALRHGNADVLVGALRERIGADVAQEHLFDDPLAIVVRAGHPLAQRRRRNARDLARHAWVAPRHGSPLRSHFETLFESCGLPIPAGTIECNSLVAARAVLLASDRIMLLSAHQVRQEVMAGQLVTLPHPAGRVVRRIGLTLRRDWRPTTAQQSLLQALRAVASSLPPR